ncbi:hypothetical protein [Bacillus sp. V2I10]|uniref:hypothetical protein n=1 Tax=Bacillus sp. V2I10 TaxID=3042276 RepID=UPI00277EB4CF|nr:hypothetical protein [Bacillus sp. V2I10]MDQ0859204.1 hypothetical protein [Bacillus sp. V2I10]
METSIWRKTKWLIKLIGSTVSLPIPSSAAANAFELIFILSLWITSRKSLKAARLNRQPLFYLLKGL